MQCTKVFIPEEGGYAAYVEELPGANTNEEARQNLIEAVQLVLEANREIAGRLKGLDAT